MRFGYARHPRIVSTEKARTWLLLSQPVSGILDAVGSKDSTRIIPPQLQNVSIQDALAVREAFILGIVEFPNTLDGSRTGVPDLPPSVVPVVAS